MRKRSFVYLLLLILVSISFFNGCDTTEKSKKDSEITKKTTKAVKLTPKYKASFSEGINFTRIGYPSFILDVTGMSDHEEWGRWTDANRGKLAKFTFTKPLPEKFILEIKAKAFGPNVGSHVKVRIGNMEKTFVPKATDSVFEMQFSGVENADTIEIIPPKPTSPFELNVNKDKRKLGVGLVKMKIIPKD